MKLIYHKHNFSAKTSKKQPIKGNPGFGTGPSSLQSKLPPTEVNGFSGIKFMKEPD
jgi:hypothetical protein